MPQRGLGRPRFGESILVPISEDSAAQANFTTATWRGVNGEGEAGEDTVLKNHYGPL